MKAAQRGAQKNNTRRKKARGLKTERRAARSMRPEQELYIYKGSEGNLGAFPALRAGNRAIRGSAALRPRRGAPWLLSPLRGSHPSYPLRSGLYHDHGQVMVKFLYPEAA
jgi:hypothetical protein